jgi:creatinine amidohydrolase
MTVSNGHVQDFDSHRMDFLPWQAVHEHIQASGVVLVPIGAVEPHGFHAPTGTDTFNALGIAERLADASGALVFPPVPLGTMHVPYDFRHVPGSVSLDPTLLIDVYTNIGTELARLGCRRLVFVNGHSGNTPVLQIAAFRVSERAHIQVGILEWWSAAAAEIEAIKGHTWGTHADEIETSILLATNSANLVHLGDAEANSPTLEQVTDGERNLYQRKITFTRRLDERWVGRSANMGDPARAEQEYGEQIVGACVRVGLQLLEALEEQYRQEQPATT